jgi:hypothetical protein
MQRNNGAAFMLLRIDSESVRSDSEALRAVVHPLVPLLQYPAFRVSQCHVLLHVLTVIVYLARLSMIHQLYIYCVCTLMGRVALLFPYHPPYYAPLKSQILTSPLMPHTHPTSTPSNFQLIFDSALKAYKKRTKNDLLTHPLADRLKACNSASSILTVLQELVQEFNQSQRRNTTWLDPTVNVLLAFSETLGEGVGSVCFRA